MRVRARRPRRQADHPARTGVRRLPRPCPPRAPARRCPASALAGACGMERHVGYVPTPSHASGLCSTPRLPASAPASSPGFPPPRCCRRRRGRSCCPRCAPRSPGIAPTTAPRQCSRPAGRGPGRRRDAGCRRATRQPGPRPARAPRTGGQGACPSRRPGQAGAHTERRRPNTGTRRAPARRDLHQQRGVVPVDVLMSDLAALKLRHDAAREAHGPISGGNRRQAGPSRCRA